MSSIEKRLQKLEVPASVPPKCLVVFDDEDEQAVRKREGISPTEECTIIRFEMVDNSKGGVDES